MKSKRLSLLDYQFNELEGIYHSFLEGQQDEPINLPQFDARHHVANYVDLLLQALEPVYEKIVDNSGRRLQLSRGDIITQELGLTEQNIADAIGDPSSKLLAFIEHEIDKVSPPDLPLGELVVSQVLEPLLSNSYLDTFELKRIGKYDRQTGLPVQFEDENGEVSENNGKGLAFTLLNILFDSDLVYLFVPVMDIYQAIETAIGMVMEAEFPGVSIPISDKLRLEVNGPYVIRLPEKFSDFMTFDYPGGTSSIGVNILIPHAAVGPNVDLRLMTIPQTNGGQSEQKWSAVTDQAQSIVLTDLNLSLRLLVSSRDDQRQEGWPYHRFFQGQWSSVRLSVSHQQLDVAIADFVNILVDAVGKGGAAVLISALVIGTVASGPVGALVVAVLGALGVFGDDVVEQSVIEPHIERILQSNYDFLLSNAAVQKLLEPYASESVTLRYPLNQADMASWLDYPRPKAETFHGSHRLYTRVPKPVEPSEIIEPVKPPEHDPIQPGIPDPVPILPTQLKTVPRLSDINAFPSWEPYLAMEQNKGNVKAKAAVARKIVKSQSLTDEDKLIGVMGVYGFSPQEISLLSPELIDKKSRKFLGRKVPKRARFLLKKILTDASDSKDKNAAHTHFWGKSSVMGSVIQKAFVNAQFELYKTHNKNAHKRRHEVDEIAPAFEPELDKVFACKNSYKSPLKKRLGSAEKPAQIELATNCVGVTELLRLMMANEQLYVTGAVHAGGGNVNHIDYDITSIEDVAADFRPRVIVQYAGGLGPSIPISSEENDRPAILAKEICGNYRLDNGVTETFCVTARIFMVPSYLDVGCLDAAAAHSLHDNLRCVQQLALGKVSDIDRIAQLQYRHFIFLVCPEIEPEAIADHMQIISGEFNHRIPIQAILHDWASQLLPLPLLYDPWYFLGDQLTNVRVKGGWIAMQKEYSVGDIAATL